MSRVIPLPLTKAQVVTSLSTHDMLYNISSFELSEGLWLGLDRVSVIFTLNHSIRKGFTEFQQKK